MKISVTGVAKIAFRALRWEWLMGFAVTLAIIALGVYFGWPIWVWAIVATFLTAIWIGAIAVVFVLTIFGIVIAKPFAEATLATFGIDPAIVEQVRI